MNPGSGVARLPRPINFVPLRMVAPEAVPINELAASDALAVRLAARPQSNHYDPSAADGDQSHRAWYHCGGSQVATVVHCLQFLAHLWQLQFPSGHHKEYRDHLGGLSGAYAQSTGVRRQPIWTVQ